MASDESKEMKKVLVFGGRTGWIGGLMVEMAKKDGTVMIILLLWSWGLFGGLFVA
jgi:hypothetical protein